MAIDSFREEFEFLSNFYIHPIEYDGIVWPSTEHAFQGMKTLNKKERSLILHEPTPGKAKRLGKTVTLRDDWESVKIDIMRDINRIKFQDPVLRAKLLATGEERLVEGNSWNDREWGVCNGVGQNLLGKILMEIRKECQADEQNRKDK